jgi:hypothetical protein
MWKPADDLEWQKDASCANPKNKKTVEKMQDMQFFYTGRLQERKNGDWFKLDGFMIKYIYFLNQSAKERLTVPILPFSKIDEIGAGMYKGLKRDKQAMDATSITAEVQHLPSRSTI